MAKPSTSQPSEPPRPEPLRRFRPVFRANVAALRFERRGKIEALSRKLARQAGAIAAFRIRYRINEPMREAAS